MPPRLLLLGSPAVELDGGSSAVPFERRTQLLAFLALKRAWVGRAELAGMLWPDQAGKLAYANLRKTLFRAQALPWAGALGAQTGAVRFDCETDVAAFERAVHEGRHEEALRLYGGDLLSGFDDDASEGWILWLNFERERLRAAWRGAAIARLGSELDPAQGVELSARLVQADPLDEAALAIHLSWLTRAGQPAQARQAYRDFAERLRDDLGLEPGAGLRALHDSLAAAALPAKRELAAASLPDDGFVGRSAELRQIATLLADPGCRLLTLVGPGGVGKTCLARRALVQLEPMRAHGAAFVPLEDASNGADVLARIASAVRLRLSPGRETIEQLVEFLGSREMLLALDNFEHLMNHADIVHSLLAECPGLKMLVTSRVRLGLRMEQLLALEGLPCPDPDDEDRLEAFDAARLFVKAAKRVAPALVPQAEAASIVEICRRVEGLPLALELAAAWTRVMPCSAIAAELREGTDLLRADDAAHPPRHASIEVVFEKTWGLLTAREREALSRLSVFHGGFTVEAARSVAAAQLPVIGALLDKSLLRREGARLRMHALVQDLAATRLAASGAREATQRAHAIHFHRFMAQVARAVQDGNRDALQAMEAELENCRSASRWAMEHGSPEMIAKAAPALLSFFDHRFRLDDGLALLSEAAESPVAAAHPRLAALLLASVAHLLYRLDRYAEAEARATTALAMTEEGMDQAARLQSFKVLGGCCLRLGRLEDAKRFFRQALRQAPAAVDPNNAAAMLDNLALVEKWMGNYAASRRLSHRSLLQHRALNDTAGEALCLNNLGALHLDLGEHEAAREHLREGLALCERHGLVGTRALVLANLTELALKAHDAKGAEFHALRALEAVQATGNRGLAAWLKLQTAGLALRRADLVAARTDLAEGLEIALALGRPSYLFEGVACFAEILVAQGEVPSARQVLRFCARHPAIGVAQRDAARARLDTLPPAAASELAWPGLGMEALVHRIVAEARAAHAPLVSLLREAREHQAADAGAA